MINKLKNYLNLNEKEILDLENLKKQYLYTHRKSESIKNNEELLNQKDLNNLIEFLDKESQLSSEQKNIIIGNILGDSHIKYSNISCSLSYGYSNENYAKFVFSKLQNLCNSIEPKKYINKKYINRISYTFSTKYLKSLNIFKDFFLKINKIENKNVKIFTSLFSLYFLISEQSLAFWIMDDGSKFKKGGLTLCTDNFTLEEVIKLNLILEIKFNLLCTIHIKNSKNKDKKYNRIYISALSLQNLRSLVLLYFLDTMLYKIEANKIKPELSTSKSAIYHRNRRAVIKNWKEIHGPNSEAPKQNKNYSNNPRAIKARMKRWNLKINK